MASEGNGNVHEDLKKWRRCDDLEGLKRRVYRALRTAEVIMYDEGSSRSERLKACTTIQQTARTYLKVLEADELEERIAALEEAFEEQQDSAQTNGRHRYN